MRELFAKYWFLTGLALAMVIGFFLADELETVSSWQWLRRAIVMAVMFLMALPLPIKSIIDTIRRPWAAFLATAMNFVLLPLVAWSLSGLVSEVYVTGFLVIAATPCTMASAAVWTRRAGGNDVTALMTTVLTNSISFLVTPLILLILIRESQSGIRFGEMVIRLGLLILLPILVAQLLASQRVIGQWARQRARKLGVSAQAGILLMVLLGTANTTMAIPAGSGNGLLHVLGLVIACSSLHILVLVAGFLIARMTRFSYADQIAVAISGSQKTLMIGLLICLTLKASLLPMVIFHASQLVIDTFVADWFLSRSRSEKHSGDTSGSM